MIQPVEVVVRPGTPSGGGTIPDPVPVLVSRNDEVEWFCQDHRFRVIAVTPVSAGAPRKAFLRFPPPLPGPFADKVISGPANPRAVGHKYKCTIEVETSSPNIDPHIDIKR